MTPGEPPPTRSLSQAGDSGPLRPFRSKAKLSWSRPARRLSRVDALLTLALLVIASFGAAMFAFGDASQVGAGATLLGGVLGYLTGTIAERSRRRHENEHRFEADRRAVYVRFLEAVDNVEKGIRERNTAASIIRDHPEYADRVEIPDLPDSSRLRLLTDEIELLAPFTVYASATMVKIRLDFLGYAADKADDDAWSAASSELQQAHSSFVKRAKSDLGTPTGVMGPWREMRYRITKGVGSVRSRATRLVTRTRGRQGSLVAPHESRVQRPRDYECQDDDGQRRHGPVNAYAEATDQEREEDAHGEPTHDQAHRGEP